MNFLRLLLTSALIAQCFVSFSGITPTHERISTVTTPVVIGQPSATKGVTSSLPNLTHFDAFKKGVVTFGVDHHYPQIFASMEVEIDVEVKRWSIYSLSSPDMADTLIKLKINYSPNDSLSFKDKASLIMNGLEKFELRIINIKVNNTNVNELPANLFIDLDLFIDRYYDFSSNSDIPINISYPINSSNLIDLDCDNINDVLKLTWTSVIGAEEYQLEWTYINDYGVGSNWYAASSLAYDFKLNSTRVSTSQTSYDISLIYDHGYICYRVRAVGRELTNLNNHIYGVWSSDEKGTVDNANYFHQDWSYEGNKNWQYSSTFAEEGKRKEVISYFDGSLRNRQMVTRVNTDENVIVGETIYDHQGRPAIQVLPTPVNLPDCGTNGNYMPSLKYYPKFNQNLSDSIYDVNHFDLTFGDTCLITSQEMSNTTGASQYYSQLNSQNSGINEYIPDAAQRPFTQIEYTPDNTGRIRRQSGVGSDFRLGSGHETKYFYGQPDQIQLRRMFGSEVGDAKHYQKNMVVDPNGQISVSYLDQEGRVIATSLAGEKPINMLGIPSLNEGAELTETLFSGTGNTLTNTLSFDGKSKVFSSTFLVSSEATYTFKYDLEVESFIDSCLIADVCFDCIYDFELIIEDECGVNLVPANISKKTGLFAVEDAILVFEIDCSNLTIPNALNEEIILNLPIGSYQIKKALKIHEPALDYYIKRYLNDTIYDSINHCVKTLQDFELEFLSEVDLTDCDIYLDCDECLTNLGTLDDYLSLGKGDVEDYNSQVEKCKLQCEETSLEDINKMLMLSDLRPDGQYGEYRDVNGVYNPSLFPLSIYNGANMLPKNIINPGEAFWKNPKMDLNGTLVSGYFADDSITRSRIEVAVTLNASQVPIASDPAVNDPSMSIFLDPIDNKYYVYPENLSNTLDFIYYWHESWAYSLMVYHPEYSYYKSFNDFSRQINSGDLYTSESFDQLLSNTETWEQAKTNGFISSNDQLNNWFVFGSTPWDPFVVRSSAFDNFGAQLQSKYAVFHVEGANSYSMPQMAAMIVRCPDLMMNPTYPSSCSDFGSFIPNQTIPYNDSIKNLEWSQLKGMYISAKQTAKLNMSDDRAVNNPNYLGYNACIGNDNFNPFLLSFFDPFTNSFGSQFFQFAQPCSFFTNILYKNKVKRFGIATDYIQYDPNEAAAQIYLQTGQCPVAFNLKSFLNFAVQNHFLAENKTSINSYSLFNSFLMELTNNTATLPIENYDWNVVINNSTQLKTTITPTLGGNQLGYIEFNKPTYPCLTFDWSDIVQIATFKATTVSGGVYNFEMLVRIQNISGYDTCMITGKTNFDIKNCTFDPTCSKNDFTKDLQKLMNALTLNGEIVSSVQVLGNNSVYQNFMSVFLKKQIYSPTITEAFWSFDNANSQFLLKRNSSASEELRIKILSTTPSSFNQSLIHSIQSIEVTGNNTISIKLIDVNANLLATLECSVSYWNGSSLIDVHVGECSLVESLTCQGEVFDNLIHLEKLIKDVLMNQNPLSSIDLISSQYADSDLQYLINFAANQTTSAHSSNLTGGVHYDTITFGSGVNCDFKLWIKSDLVDVSFDNVVSMADFLPYGLPNNSGKFTTFYVVTDFFSTTSNLTYRDTVFGKSCLAIDRCVPCFEEELAIYDTDRYCQNLYKSYLNSYAQFIDNQLTNPTCSNYSSTNPVYSYTDFINSGACCSEETMELLYTDFITPYTSFNLTACPPIIPVYESCDLVESPVEECVENYENYLRALSAFNNSPWAIEHNRSFNTAFFSYSNLIQSGKCYCIPSYISYLQTYVNALSTDVLPVPFGILSEGFPACENSLPSEMDTCFVLYKAYLDAYGNFMQNDNLEMDCPNFYTQVPFFSYQDFINSNACCSTNSMLDFGYNYLSQFGTTTPCPTSPLGVYSPTCPNQNDVNQPCLADYTLFLETIIAFNQSPWVVQNDQQITDFYSFQETIDNERCYCLSSYSDYLQTYIQAGANDVLTDPQSLKSFPNCSLNIPTDESLCEVMYSYYLSDYIDYLNNYTYLCVTENVAPLFSYQDFINSGICCSVNDLYDFQNNYLSQFVNPTTCPTASLAIGTNTCNFQNDNSCLDLRAALINKINTFNSSPWAIENSITLSYSGYFGRGIETRASVFKCDCIPSYLTYLDPYIAAAANESLPIPEDITSFTGCVLPPDSPEKLCEDSYYDYLGCIQNYNNWATSNKKQVVGAADILTQNAYVSGNYCDCLSDYCNYLQQVEAGNISAFNFSIATAIDDFCDAPKATIKPCAPELPWIEVGDVPTEIFLDPCTEILNNTALVNAQNAYNSYRDSLIASFIDKYTKHCMGANESLSKKYFDAEHHRTLYYYDQAGNLIKTIPPEGVELLNTFSATDPIGLLLKADQDNNTQHVLTNHRMATIYEYNSLNQLIRQTMPDHDQMEIWDVTYPNGLHIDLVTTAIQMVNENTGYLSGYVLNNSISQGYLYKTTNGGSNWVKMDNTVAGELKKIQMVSTNVGYAIGATGVILKSTNSGSTWNLLNTFATGNVNEFVDLHFTSITNGRFVSKDGSLLLTSNGGSSFASGSLTIPTTSNILDVEVKSMAFDGTNYYYAITRSEVGLVGDIILQVDANNVASIEPIWSNGYQAIDYYADNQGYIAGKNGILVSFSYSSLINYRQTLVPNKDGGDFSKIYFLDQQNGVGLRKDLLSTATQVVYTKNGGVDWTVFEQNVTYKDLTLLKKDGNKMYFYGLTSEGKVNRLMFSPNIPLAMVNTSLISNSSFALNPSIFATFEKIFSVEKNGTSSMIFIGSSDGKVYRSELLTLQNQQTSFTLLGQLNPSNTAEKLDQLEGFISFSGSVSGIIKSSNQKLFSLFANAFNSIYTINSVSVSGQSSPVVTALTKDASSEKVFAYEQNAKKMHSLLLNGSSVPSTTIAQNTGVTSGTGTGIIALDFQGDQVTMINSTGEIYTSSSFAGTSFMNAGYSHRSHLLATSINSLLQSTGTNTNLMAVGDHGRYLERVIVNTQSIWKISPIGTNEKLNGIISVGNEHLIVGNNGFVKHFDQPTLITSEVYFPSNNASASALYHNVDFKSAISSTEGTYVVGSKGTLLYSNLNDMSSFKGITNVITGDFNAIAIVPGSSSAGFPKAFAVGTQASIYRFYGLTNSKIVNVFPNKIEDVHFYDAMHGTMVGENFFVRQTNNGGQTWNLVVPGVNVPNQLNKTLNSVWTKEGNRAIIGGVNYLASVNNGFALDQSFSETIRDIQFSKTNGTLGYLASGNNVRSFSYIYNASSNAITLNLSSILSNASNQVNALHVFDNGNVMAVGNNSFVGYLAINTGSTNFTNFPTGNSGEKYNAIFFHDFKNGYIGGDQGVLYQTAIVETNSQTNVINLLTWSARDNDLVTALTANSSGSLVDINAISFSTRTKGLIGGKYHSNYVTSDNKGYVRLISDESQQYGTRFYYDRLGRLVVSQNARQYKDRKFSYTLYDALGRVYEAGEKSENTQQASYLSVFGTTIGGQEIPSVIDDAKLATWISGDGLRKEVTRSYYDATTLAGLPANFSPIAENLRKRIAHVTYESVYDGNDQTYDHATHYNYDIHGNVQTMLQDNPSMAADPLLTHQQFKRLDYNYDLVSGNVHRVSYEIGKVDQWHHAYVYDADNRITDVYTTNTTPLTTPSHGQSTSQNEPEISPFWDKEAHYKYYAHGPLARIELGEQKVQGLDYVYTLQGWLKGVNSNVLNAENDPGKDGIDLATNLFARDVIGYSLHYFSNDYTGIGSASNNRTADQTGSDLTANSTDLYNGNIARMVTTITNPDTREILPLGNAYKYDQLNRIRESRSFSTLNLNTNTWTSASTYNGKYYNGFDYEANGNILHQLRNNSLGNPIDSLTYRYQKDAQGKMIRNRLYHVNDHVDNSNFTDDIDDMGVFASATDLINTSNNYSYDEEGRLIRDNQEDIEEIVWRVDGKVKSIIRPVGSSKKNLTFEYNAMGQRIAKHVMNADNELEKSTYYVLDAQGNTMSVYERVVDNSQSSVQYYQAENHIYGSSRLGMQNTHVNLLGSVPLEANVVSVDHQIGLRNYELSNHLGNVLTVISDKPIPHDDGNGNIAYFMADILKATDYSPFGVILDDRDFEKQLPEIRDTTYTQQYYQIYASNFDISSWTQPTYDNWNAENVNVSLGLTGSSNRLRVESSNVNDGVIREFTTVPGHVYQVSFYVDKGTLPNVNFKAYDVSPTNVLTQISAQTMSASQVYTYTFTASQTKMRLKFHQAGVFLIDDIVLKDFTLTTVDFTDLENPVYVEPSVDAWTYEPNKERVYAESNSIYMLPTNYGKVTRSIPLSFQTQSFTVQGNIQISGSNPKNASLWLYTANFGSSVWDSTMLYTTSSGGSFNQIFYITGGKIAKLGWKTNKSSTIRLTAYTLKKSNVNVHVGNFTSPVIIKPSYDGWTIDTKTQLLRKKYIGNSNKLIPGVQKTFSTVVNTNYRFSADISYLASGGVGIGMFSAETIEPSMEESNVLSGNESVSALSFDYYDSIIVYRVNGSQLTRITAKRYSGTGPIEIFFTAPSSQIKVEFVPGNVMSQTYAYYVDNMKLSTMTGSTIYSSNFTTATIVSQNTDGWQSNWASSYLNIISGTPNQLRVRGTAPAIVRTFTNVQANNEHHLTYTQTQNNAVQLVVEQSANGTTWSTLLTANSANGTHTQIFTPTASYLRVRYSASSSFQVSEVILNGVDETMVVNVTPGGFAKYRYSFQGQEHDDEIKGKGNSVNYQYRMHDPRLGRFFAVDPKFQEYPFMSPYCFAANDPIRNIDENGEGPGDRVKAAKQFLTSKTGYQYSMGSDNIGRKFRTTFTKAALQKQDCIELVTRVLYADGVIKTMNVGKYDYYLANKASIGKVFFDKSKFIQSTTPQIGDVAFWEGHVGIVSEVGKGGTFKLTHAANSNSDILENPNNIKASQYRSSTFHGFFRPLNETPDGKPIDITMNNGTSQNENEPQAAKVDNNVYFGGEFEAVEITGQSASNSSRGLTPKKVESIDSTPKEIIKN